MAIPIFPFVPINGLLKATSSSGIVCEGHAFVCVEKIGREVPAESNVDVALIFAPRRPSQECVMIPKFTYNDIVVAHEGAPPEFRPGEKAWVIGVFTDRTQDKFSWLPAGVVYAVEFEDGEAIDVNEDILHRYETPQ